MQDKEDTTGFGIFANERGNLVICADGPSWLSAKDHEHGRTMARRVVILAAAIAMALAVNLAPFSGLRLNFGASMPRGLYRLTDERPARGDLVAFCVDAPNATLAMKRQYLGSGSCPGRAEALLKRVIAVAGDVVTTSESSLSVNGVPVGGSATASRDSHGRPLDHDPFGRHRLAADELWVFSPADRSWDSRYFGPVRSSAVLATVEPVLTLE